MSDDSNPIFWKEAAEAAASFVKLIGDLTPCYLAGSLRRKKTTVNDIEIVTRAPSRAALLARLDTLVRDGVCQKAVYQEGTHRWDIKYAGIVFQGVRIEVFSATPENFGYIQWLRTGPADANKYVMQALSNWPIRFDDGSAWLTTYERGLKTLKYRLRVPDEATLFNLIGMAYLKPEQRTVAAYKRLLKRTPPSEAFIEGLRIVDQPKQASLL